MKTETSGGMGCDFPGTKICMILCPPHLRFCAPYIPLQWLVLLKIHFNLNSGEIFRVLKVGICSEFDGVN